jgi:hypothetical protein
MRALSIRQPWAWLIVASLKDVENRSRRVSHRGPVLIYASKQMATIPVREIEQRFGVAIPESELRFDGVIGIAELVDCVSEHGSQWFEGPWGLVLHNARPLPFVRFPGQLGIFQCPTSSSPRR